MSPDVVQRIHGKLRDISNVFPGTTTVVVLGHDGQLKLHQSPANTKVENIAAMVSSLKRAAVQFGDTLGQMESPVIHVVGQHTIFSCYHLGANLLAFFSGMAETAIELFDLESVRSIAPYRHDFCPLLLIVSL
jgi:predicted regulator of Ras-like GTPase activity (Roadblock/LC7/MglB family)